MVALRRIDPDTARKAAECLKHAIWDVIEQLHDFSIVAPSNAARHASALNDGARDLAALTAALEILLREEVGGRSISSKARGNVRPRA